jgi:hypothetical protein
MNHLESDIALREAQFSEMGEARTGMQYSGTWRRYKQKSWRARTLQMTV